MVWPCVAEGSPGAEPEGDDDTAPTTLPERTIVAICPTCSVRAQALQLPEMKGVKVSSVVVVGLDGTERWTVLVSRAHKHLASGTGTQEGHALFEALTKLGVLHR